MICPGCDRLWFICHKHELGLVPLGSTGSVHEEDAWHKAVNGDDPANPTKRRTKAECIAAGFVAVRMTLCEHPSCTARTQGTLRFDDDQQIPKGELTHGLEEEDDE